MNLDLVKAEPEDIHFFVALNELSYQELVARQFGAWDSRYQAEEFVRKWPHAEFCKVYRDGELVGGIWVNEFSEHHELREIQVLPQYRGQGIGTALIMREIEKARALGRSLRLRVLLENRAFNLYKRLGFKVVVADDVRYHMEIT